MYNYNLVNADTDSIMVSKPDGSPFSPEEQEALIKELNGMFPEHINWDEDGYFESVLVVKAKNYVLKEYNSDKIKTKGSSIKDQKKEPALREMMDRMIEAMIYHRQEELPEIYNEYVREALNVKDISRWCQKKTITESIMDCAKGGARKNEQNVYEAIMHEPGIQQGDKVYLYPVILGQEIIPGGIGKNGKPLKDKIKEITGLKMDKYWTEDQDVEKLVERVYSTVEIFEKVLNMEQFPNYSLKANKYLLAPWVPEPMKLHYQELLDEHNAKVEKARKKLEKK